MNTDHIELRRMPVVLRPDPARVLVRPFLPATEPRPPDPSTPARVPLYPSLPAIEPGQPGRSGPSRITRVTDRVLAMTPTEVEAELAGIWHDFGTRHEDLRTTLADRFTQVCGLMLIAPVVPDDARRLLIGAYFSLEYSFEAAALFNPSIVLHPDQGELASGEARFVLSLRATGEGHISSICFRSGIVDAHGDVRMDPPGRYATTPSWNGPVRSDGGFEVAFPASDPLASRVIFPITPKQRNGLEDARFVRFVEDDGAVAYYATYTAYGTAARLGVRR